MEEITDEERYAKFIERLRYKLYDGLGVPEYVNKKFSDIIKDSIRKDRVEKLKRLGLKE